MSLQLSAAAIGLVCLLSCNGENKRTNEANVPEAMQTSKDYTSGYKRGPDDPVNTIYANLVKKSEELKVLEDRLEQLQDERNDSLATFAGYKKRSDDYYAAAERHVEGIKDSATAAGVLAVIHNSKNRFYSSLNTHTLLSDSIGNCEKN
jgi:hypothetical protein